MGKNGWGPGYACSLKDYVRITIGGWYHFNGELANTIGTERQHQQQDKWTSYASWCDAAGSTPDLWK